LISDAVDGLTGIFRSLYTDAPLQNGIAQVKVEHLIDFWNDSKPICVLNRKSGHFDSWSN
jgi:hypothetical protein